MEQVNQNEIGKIEIAPEVIQVVSSLAANQVPGVVSLTGSLVGDISQLLGKKNHRQGVRVDFENETVIEVSAVLEYGYSIPEVGRDIQEKVKEAVESMTGIPVDRIVVRFEGVRLPQAPKENGKEKQPRLK